MSERNRIEERTMEGQPGRSAVLLLLLAVLVGCQTPTANYFRDQVFPQEPATKIVAAPVLLPIYILVTLGDLFVGNPVRGASNVPENAAGIWAWGNKDPWIGYGVLMPVKVIAIPVGAVGTTMFSEQFDYSSRAPRTRRPRVQ